MTVYVVKSLVAFNGYRRGDTFEARLDPGMEARALARGAIEIVDESTPGLVPGSYRLPRAADAAETEVSADADTDTDQGRRRHRA